MANDQYLAMVSKRFGRIKGEATSKGMEDQIDVVDFKFVVDSPSRSDAGTEEGSTSHSAAGPATFGAAKFSILVNTATPRLFDAIVNNDVITTATLSCRKSGGGNSGALQIYYQIRFSTARVTHFELTTTTGGAPTLEIQLDYEKVEMVYLQQKNDGTLETTGIKASWNLSDNAVPDNGLPDPKGWGNSK